MFAVPLGAVNSSVAVVGPPVEAKAEDVVPAGDPPPIDLPVAILASVD